jgi:ElaA protein
MTVFFMVSPEKVDGKNLATDTRRLSRGRPVVSTALRRGVGSTSTLWHDRNMNPDPSTKSALLVWSSRAFEALSPTELQYIYMARQQVFGIEQNCIYQDIDGADPLSRHLAAWSPQHTMPLAYARLVAPGVKYVQPSIGRVITTAPARGTGLGRELMRRAIALATDLYPGQGICISAQSRLETFYGGMGFAIVGERYLEDGIPHTQMLLRN